MEFLFTRLPIEATCGCFFVLGAIVGKLLAIIAGRMALEPAAVQSCDCGDRRSPASWIPIIGFLLQRGRCRQCNVPLDRTELLTEITTAILFAGFVFANLQFECQKTHEVRPDTLWQYGRIVFHLVLIGLLVAATATDVRDYIIPDAITILGMAIGLLAATLVGDLQTVHLWVDWNYAIPSVRGPFIPAWFQTHPHWHGLAWSLAGLVAGGGITWLARVISSFALGQESLGFGDVTLIAMIGSFIGWQPVVFVFLLAPFCGLVVGLLVKLIANRPYVPYGPFLAVATLVVLFSWRWLWQWEPNDEFSIRHLFGDGQSLAILAGVASGSLVLLLGALRLYRLIPGKQRDELSE